MKTVKNTQKSALIQICPKNAFWKSVTSDHSILILTHLMLTQLEKHLKIWSCFNICAHYGKKMNIVGHTESFAPRKIMKSF